MKRFQVLTAMLTLSVLFLLAPMALCEYVPLEVRTDLMMNKITQDNIIIRQSAMEDLVNLLNTKSRLILMGEDLESPRVVGKTVPFSARVDADGFLVLSVEVTREAATAIKDGKTVNPAFSFLYYDAETSAQFAVSVIPGKEYTEGKLTGVGVGDVEATGWIYWDDEEECPGTEGMYIVACWNKDVVGQGPYDRKNVVAVDKIPSLSFLVISSTFK